MGATAPELPSPPLSSPELGYAVWPVMDENTRHNWDFYVIDTLSYVSFDDMGNVSPVQTVRGQLSDCQPIPVDGKLVWYVTDQSIPTFYTLGEDGLTAHTVVQPNVTRTLTFISEGETVETRLPSPRGSDRHAPDAGAQGGLCLRRLVHRYPLLVFRRGVLGSLGARPHAR